MQTAVEQLRAALTARFGTPKRYDEFQYWTTGDAAHTRFTLYFDGRRCRVFASDSTTHAPALVAEFERADALLDVLGLIDERAKAGG